LKFPCVGVEETVLKFIMILILLVLIWGVAYFYLKSRTDFFANKYPDYIKRMQTSLEEMFILVSEGRLRSIVLLLTIVLGAVGFLLPGQVAEIDTTYTIDRAIEFNKKENYERVAILLEDLANLDSPIVHNELGIAYLGLENYDRAVQEFSKALEILPEYSKAHYNLSFAYTKVGKFLEASFEASKGKETEKYDISKKALYNISGSMWDNLPMRLFLAVILAFLGYRALGMLIRFLKQRRRKKFDNQLPDGLNMAANGLRAGFSLIQAIEMVSKETPPPLSQEFELVLKEHRLGLDLKDALNHLSERMGTGDTKIFVNSILILLDTGGNLTEIFDTIAETIQERKRVHQKIQTMTAEGQTQAYILAILPLALAFLMNKMSPGTFDLMLTTFLGWLLILLVAGMEIVGIYWMLKTVRVKI